VVSTEQFGDLVMNPTIGWFEGKRRWNDKLIDVSFETSEDGGIGDAIKTAESLWSDQEAWKHEVDNLAVEKLLPLKNECWLGDDEAEITSEDFKARMTLQSISVGSDGRFGFHHDDGDLFWGHTILVSGNLKEGLNDAEFYG
jgi:hypothetical protein